MTFGSKIGFLYLIDRYIPGRRSGSLSGLGLITDTGIHRTSHTILTMDPVV